MGLDGLGSSSYGPEAALAVMIPLGAANLSYMGWVMAPIVGPLAILFVAVGISAGGISAGVGALVSAIPALHPYMLSLCLLAFITVVNLRGTIDAGRMFAVPTYTFVVSFAVIMGSSLWKMLTSGGHPLPIIRPRRCRMRPRRSASGCYCEHSRRAVLR